MNNWKKRSISFLLVICMIFGVLTVSALAVEAELEPMSNLPFTDVQSADWFFPAVQFVHANNVMSGTSPTTFEPHQNFSRAMVVTTLFRIYHGRPANASDSRVNPFHDVSADAWFAPYVTWANQNGIAGGIGEGYFAPLQNVDRQQFATMLYRYAQTMTNMDTSVRQALGWISFSDRNQIQNWAVNPLIWANYHGLITGRPGGLIAPTGNATRAEAATILMRFMTPAPAPLNIADLMDANFNTLRPSFGRLIGPVSSAWERMYRFESGLLIGVDGNGLVASVQVDFVQVGSSRFSYNGINHMSNRHEVRLALGAPTGDDGISYTYWLSGTPLEGILLSFTFDSLNQDRVSTIAFSDFSRMVPEEPSE